MWFKFKYPKLSLLIIFIVLAYFVFRNAVVNDFIMGLGAYHYLGVFIAGFLFSFGFTAPFAVGFFIMLNPENLLFSTFIGSLGASISNLLIFKLIRFSFKEEFKDLENSLEKTKPIKKFEHLIRHLKKKTKLYLMYAFIGILIASPLPNEAGDIILAGMTKVKTKILVMMSFILSFIGIIILLLI